MVVHQAHNSLGNYSYNAFFYDDCDWFYHFHKNYELIYVLSGQVELTLSGRTFLLEAETFALVLPNQFHAYRTPDASRAWVAVFSADFVEEFAKLTQGKQAQDPRFACDEVTRQFLLQELICDRTPELLTMKAALYTACSRFAQQAVLTDAGQEQDLISNIIRYVTQHFQEGLTFRSIAEEFGYEYHYFSRQFQRHFDMNFRQFLNHYRLDRAREMLLYSDAPITEVAYSAGFQTVRSFNRAFLDAAGMTPSAFRRTSPRLRQQRQNSDGTLYYADTP